MLDRIGGQDRPLPLKRNAPNKVDGLDLMAEVQSGSAALVFIDPQYRGLMDAMKYGNEGVRQRRRAALPQMTDQTISWFVKYARECLRPSGHLVLWIDKFSLGGGRHLRWIARASDLRMVDLIAWNTTLWKMGKRTRGSMEYALVLQREPKLAKGLWLNRRFSDGWTEEVDRSRHPHAKPHRLTLELIRATTKRGDLVVDPCAGSYGVLAACIETGREFFGGDLVDAA